MGDQDLQFRAGLDAEAFNAGIGKMLKSVTGFAAGFFTLGKAADLLKDMAKKAEENETATMALASAVKSLKTGTEAGFIALNNYAEKMSETTGIAQTDLKGALQALVYETGNTAAAQNSLGAAIDISQAKHVSLEVAAKAVGRAYEGNTTMLKRWGIELEHGEHGMQAISDLTKKFGGAEDSYLNTTAGKLKVAQNNFNLLENEIGTNFLPALGNAAMWVAKFLQSFTPTGAKIQELQQHIENLTTQLNEISKQPPSFKNMVDAQGLTLQIKESKKQLESLGGAWGDAASAAKLYKLASGTAQSQDEDGAATSKKRALGFNDVGKAMSDLASLSKTKNKEMFGIAKAASIGAIIASTAETIMKTGAELGYPLAIPFQAAAAVEGGVQLAVASGATFSAANGLYNDTGESMISTFKPQEMVIPSVFSQGIMSGKYSLHGGNTSNTTSGDTIIHVNAGNKSIDQTLREVKTYINNNRGGRLTRADGSLNV